MKNKINLFFFIGIFVIFLDLLTKSIAENQLANRVIEVIPGFFNLVLVWNKGAAFGIIANAPEIIRKIVLIGSSTIAAIITTMYVIKSKEKLSIFEIVSLSLIAGGSVGNLYDRLFIGAVRDFLDFYIGQHHWPAFNIADASISIGIFLFIFYELFWKKKHLENKEL